MKNEIKLRKDVWTLRGTYRGTAYEIQLGKDKKIATTKKNRFLAILETSGLEAAKLDLTGKTAILAGCNPTFDEMEVLFRDFCRQAPDAPREISIKTYVNRLKTLMDRAKVERVARIDKDKLFEAWFGDNDPTPAGKRTFASAVKNAQCIFSVQALEYYQTNRNITLKNPFTGLKLARPKPPIYQPMALALRESLLNDSIKELPANEAMIVWLALCAGLRKSEITACLPSWIRKHKDNATIHVGETDHFIPKSGEAGIVPVTHEAYETLKKLRGNSDSPFFVPYDSKKTDSTRLREPVNRVVDWLKKKGVKNNKPLHALRKEFGSQIATDQGLPAAASALRNTLEVCMATYVGKGKVDTVNMRADANKMNSLEDVAAQFGMTVEQLKTKLAS